MVSKKAIPCFHYRRPKLLFWESAWVQAPLTLCTTSIRLTSIATATHTQWLRERVYPLSRNIKLNGLRASGFSSCSNPVLQMPVWFHTLTHPYKNNNNPLRIIFQLLSLPRPIPFVILNCTLGLRSSLGVQVNRFPVVSHRLGVWG